MTVLRAKPDRLVNEDDATPLAQLRLEVLRGAERHPSRRHQRICVAFRGAFHHPTDEAESARARLMRRGDGYYGTSPRHEPLERTVLADEGSDARRERRHDVRCDVVKHDGLAAGGGPACAHHCRSGTVGVTSPAPSSNGAEESTARTADTMGWKVGSRSAKREGKMGVISCRGEEVRQGGVCLLGSMPRST